MPVNKQNEQTRYHYNPRSFHVIFTAQIHYIILVTMHEWKKKKIQQGKNVSVFPFKVKARSLHKNQRHKGYAQN